MATLSQNLETIANNVTSIASESARILENGRQTIIKETVKGTDSFNKNDFNNILNNYDYTRYIEQWHPWKTAPLGIPILYLNGDTTGMNKDTKKDMTFKFGSTIKGYVEGTCTCKWQGASSTSHAKKNYTIAKLSTKIDMASATTSLGWGERKKFVLKANFIDASQARNIVGARLWGQIVKSRTGTGPLLTRLKALPNAGAIDGYPIMLVINDKFQGIYTMNIPKDEDMMGMGDGELQAILCAESNNSSTSVSLKVPLLAENIKDGGDFSLEYNSKEDETDVQWIADSVSNMINAAVNSTGIDYRTSSNLQDYLYIDSLIDYMIFSSLIGDTDGRLRNWLLSTFDGTKWFFTAYDIDGVWGNSAVTPGFGYPKTTQPTFANWNSINRVAHLIYTYDKEALKTRYEYLRNNAMSENNVLTQFCRFFMLIPRNLMLIDDYIWPTKQSSFIEPLTQIMEWYRLRCQYIDAEIAAL